MIKLNNKFVTRLYRQNSYQKNVKDSSNRTLHVDCTATANNTAAYTKNIPSGSLNLAKMNTLGGKCVAWNQLVQNGNFADDSTWSKYSTWSIANNKATFSSSSAGFNNLYQTAQTVIGHKYYLQATISDYSSDGTLNNSLIFSQSFGNYPDGWKYDLTSNGTYSAIKTADADVMYIGVKIQLGSGKTLTESISNYMCVDLTLLYGAGNEPSTTAQFLADYPQFNSYVAYDSGSIKTAPVSSVESVGMNLFDKDNPNIIHGYFDGNPSRFVEASGHLAIYIPCEPNKSYFITKGTVSASSRFGVGYTTELPANNVLIYDEWDTSSGVYHTVNTGADAKYLIFWCGFSTQTSVFNSIQICLDSLPDKTIYHPYTKHTYAIPAEVQALDGYGWSAGSVSNYIDYARKKFVKCVGKRSFNGSASEEWVTHREYWQPYGVYRITIDGTLSTFSANAVCDKFSTATRVVSASQLDLWQIMYGYGGFYVRTNITTGEADFKTWLASNPIDVYYELATPIETDISQYITDNVIQVENGGTVTFTNTNKLKVPNSETFYIAN